MASTALAGFLAVGGRGVAEERAAAVREAVEGLIAADNAEDLEGVLAHYREDAVLLPPDGPPVEGRAAFAPRYRELFRDFDVELELTIEELAVTERWAWCRGRTRGRFSPRPGTDGDERQVDDKFLMILAPGADGGWSVHTLAWSPAATP